MEVVLIDSIMQLHRNDINPEYFLIYIDKIALW